MHMRTGFLRAARTSMLCIVGSLVCCLGQSYAEGLTDGTIVIVMNKPELEKKLGEELGPVLQLCQNLTGGNDKHIVDAGTAYREQFGKPLAIDAYPAKDSDEKALWLREWLADRIEPGYTVALLGDEGALPTWHFHSSSFAFTADSLYGDLDGNGMPETAVARIIGSSKVVARQLRGKEQYGLMAVILCSEDTRIHHESRLFAKNLSQIGYNVNIRGSADLKALSQSDVIVHFGHGSTRSISNRFNRPFAVAGAIPFLEAAPIVFVEGGGTISPLDSPLLNSFLEQGATGYFGSTGPVFGQKPAYLAGEMMEHLLRINRDSPNLPLPRLLCRAQAEYVRGHPELQEVLRLLAVGDLSKLTNENLPHVITVLEWTYYGDPRAIIKKVGPATALAYEAFSLKSPIELDADKNSWETSYLASPDQGQVVLALCAELPGSEVNSTVLSVRQGDQELTSLNMRDATQYIKIGKDCRGGYLSKDTYRARFLIPLLGNKQGPQRIGVRLVSGPSVTLTSGTGIDIWPPDFEKQINPQRTAIAIPKFAIPEKYTEIPQYMQGCVQNLLEINEAIGEYKREKGGLPDWLSDLVPEFLAADKLLCPDDPQHEAHNFVDPNLPCSYDYEFCNAPFKPGSEITCRQWKAAQVRRFGLVVPLIRCHSHGDRHLNLSIHGRVYLSPLQWERLFVSFIRTKPQDEEP